MPYDARAAYEQRLSATAPSRNIFADAALGVAGGIAEGIEGMAELPTLIPGIDYDLNLREGLGIAQTETWAGDLTSGISQFLVGYGAVGALSKIGKVQKLFGALPGAAKISNRLAKMPTSFARAVRGGAHGAAADFIAFSGEESNLSNMLQNMGFDYVSFLAIDEDDGEMTARLKTTLEGAGLGAAFDGLLGAFRGVRKVRKLAAEGKMVEAERVIDEEVVPAVVEVQKLDLTAEDKALRESMEATSKEVDKAIEANGHVLNKANLNEALEVGKKQNEVAARVKLPSATDGMTTNELKKAYDADLSSRMVPERHIQSFARAGRELGIPEDMQFKEAIAFNEELVDGRWVQEAMQELGDANVFEYAGAGKKGKKRVVNPRVNTISDYEATMLVFKHNPQLAAEFTKRKGWAETEKKAIEAWEQAGLGPYDADLAYATKYYESTEQARVAQVVLTGRQIKRLRELGEMSQIAEKGQDAITKWAKEVHGVDMTEADFRKRMAHLFIDYGAVATKKYGGDANIARGLQGMQRRSSKLNNYISAMQQHGWTPGESWDDYAKNELRANAIDSMSKEVRQQISDQITEAHKLEVGMKTVADLMADGKLSQAMRGALLQAMGGADPRWMRMWMFSLLSGVKTMSAAMIGSFMTRALDPMERLAGHMIRGGATKEIKDSIVAELADVVNIGGFWEHLRRAWKRGESIFDGRAPYEALGIGLDLNPAKTAFGRRLNKVLDTPKRALIAIDEATKVMASNKMLATKFIRLGQSQNLAGDELNKFVEARISAALKNDVLLTRQSLEQRAMSDVLEKYGNNIAAKNFDFFDQATYHRMSELQADPVVKDVLQTTGGVADDVSRLTFTNEIPEDTVFTSVGGKARALLQSHRGMALVLPFVKAPVNMIDYARRRVGFPIVNPEFFAQADGLLDALVKQLGGKGSPLPEGLRKKLQNFGDASRTFTKQLSSKDPDIAAGALGRAVTSAAAMGSIAMAYYGGLITGSGPPDPQMRRAMEAEGWQPFSLKVGDKYLSLSRIEPFGSMFALMGELFETMDNGMEEGNGSVSGFLNGMVTGVTATFAQNALNKSYLAGISSFIDAINDPENKMVSFVSRIGATFMVPNAIAQFRDLADDELGTTGSDFGFIRQLIERTGSRLPGGLGEAVTHPLLKSWDLPGMAIKRNFLGEPMERAVKTSGGAEAVGRMFNFGVGMRFNIVSDSTIMDELQMLGHPMQPPKPKMGGVDLRDLTAPNGRSAFDRYLELSGEVRIQGRTMRQALTKLIGSSAYRKLPEQGIDALSEESPRVREINMLVREYRGEAQRRLEQELPEIRGFINAKIASRQGLRDGKDPEALRSKLLPGIGK